jgi:hypothetical protein
MYVAVVEDGDECSKNTNKAAAIERLEIKEGKFHSFSSEILRVILIMILLLLCVVVRTERL